jgi:hypothetical protein
MTEEIRRQQHMPAATPFRPKTRWAAWEGGVLSRVQNPTGAQDLILERQQELDDDAAGAEAIAEVFRGQIRDSGGDPRRGRYFLPNELVRQWLFLATSERLPANRATTRLKALGIPQLETTSSGKDSKGHGCRGWHWTGEEAQPDARVQNLRRPN